MSEKKQSLFVIDGGLLDKRDRKPDSKPPRAAASSEADGKTTEPELAAIAPSDTRDLGSAPTVIAHTTPPPRPTTAEREPAQSLLAALEQEEADKAKVEPPKVATYERASLKLEPTRIRVNERALLSVIGHRADGTEEVVDIGSGCVITPDGVANYDEQTHLVTALKAGTAKISIAFLDPTSGTFEESLPFTVDAEEPSIIVTDSLAHISAEATAAHAAEERKTREKHATVSGTPLESEFFRNRPKAMTENGSAIHPLPGEAQTAQTAPPPAETPVVEESTVGRKVHHPAREMQAVTVDDITRAERRKTFIRTAARFVAYGMLALFFGGMVVGGLVMMISHMPPPEVIASSLPTSTPTVPDAAPLVHGLDVPDTTEATTVLPTETALVAHPTPVPHTGEPGLHGTVGQFVRTSARAAFPTSCETGRFPDGISVLCGLRERRGHDRCDCDVAGFVH